MIQRFAIGIEQPGFLSTFSTNTITVEEKWKLPEEWYQRFRERVSEEDLAKFLDQALSDFK